MRAKDIATQERNVYDMKIEIVIFIGKKMQSWPLLSIDRSNSK